MPGDRLRLFVAVDVPDAVRDAIAAACAPLRDRAPDARWVDPARWHLTLAFLGSVERERVPAISAALTAATAAAAVPHVALDGRAGTFRRQVLWAGLAPSPELDALAAAVRAELTDVGIAFDDKPFRPHLTLARAPGRGRLPAGLETAYQGPALAWDVTEVALVRSVLAGRASRYTREAVFPLGGARA